MISEVEEFLFLLKIFALLAISAQLRNRRIEQMFKKQSSNQLLFYVEN